MRWIVQLLLKQATDFGQFLQLQLTVVISSDISGRIICTMIWCMRCNSSIGVLGWESIGPLCTIWRKAGYVIVITCIFKCQLDRFAPWGAMRVFFCLPWSNNILIFISIATDVGTCCILWCTAWLWVTQMVCVHTEWSLSQMSATEQMLKIPLCISKCKAAILSTNIMYFSRALFLITSFFYANVCVRPVGSFKLRLHIIGTKAIHHLVQIIVLALPFRFWPINHVW